MLGGRRLSEPASHKTHAYRCCWRLFACHLTTHNLTPSFRLSVRLRVFLSRCPVWPPPQPGRQTQSGSLAPQASLLVPGQAFCFCGIASPPTPPRSPARAGAVVGWGWVGLRPCSPWSRQVGFDKADQGDLHASGDIVLGVDLECDQSARLPVVRGRTSF